MDSVGFLVKAKLLKEPRNFRSAPLIVLQRTKSREYYHESFDPKPERLCKEEFEYRMFSQRDRSDISRRTSPIISRCTLTQVNS